MSPKPTSGDIGIIGAGIVGAAIAYKLKTSYPDLRLWVWEKESAPAAHQTGRNSGVIHSGIYYKPGSLKATLCRQGRQQLIHFAQENAIPHEICGKIIIATHPEELDRIEPLYQRGKENGLTQIEKIDAQTIRELEPFAAGLAGIWVPYTGIIDFAAVTRKLLEVLPTSNVLYRAPVRKIRKTPFAFEIHTDQGIYHVKHLIAAGGLQADRLVRLQDPTHPLPLRVVPFRGDYYELHPQARHKVRNIIYPLPHPVYPVLGVHLTRMVDGRIECGPNAVFAWAREQYHRYGFSLRDTWEALSYIGSWRFFARNWRIGVEEQYRALSKKLFLRSLQRLVPALASEDLIAPRSGIRALCLTPEGNFVDDFAFLTLEGSLHILNAPSPAATAALAIADEVIRKAQQVFGL
ncbi:MAG: L-2-hydroxyglutarate oxidase [Bacteroidia bacterium]